MAEKQQISRVRRNGDVGLLLLCMAAVYIVVLQCTGTWPWVHNDYNSYALQAQRWLEGHLDLGQNVSHLEIAVYRGRYFVSFPPFPSVVLLPFVLLFGTNTPDHLLCIAAGMVGAVFCMKLAQGEGASRRASIIWALMATVCGNFLFVAVNGGVWFMAQTFAFALSAGALWCLRQCRARSAVAWGLFLWACAVGCRPLNAVYAPLLLWLIGKRYAQLGTSWKSGGKHFLLSCLPAAVVTLFYMVLNAARFGNPLEFGHNYLPEFTESTYGQFSIYYLAENIGRLFRLPTFENGHFVFPHFDGVAFWLVSPIFLVFTVTVLRALRRRESQVPWTFVWITVLSVAVHFILLALHKTMGGWHFGNRYTVDAIPFLFAAFAAVRRQHPPGGLSMIWSLFTLLLNVVGIAMIYAA